MFADPWINELYDRSKKLAKVMGTVQMGVGFHHLNDNAFSRWLYEDNWSEAKLQQYELLNSIPIVSNYMDYLLDRRSDQEYLDRYGMDYPDIHDPRKLKQSSSASVVIRSGYEMISKNLDKLYR